MFNYVVLTSTLAHFVSDSHPSSTKRQTAHTLIASDEHSKRQWMSTIQKTIDSYFVASAKRKMQETQDHLLIQSMVEETDSRARMMAAMSRELPVTSSASISRQQTPAKKLAKSSRQALFQVG